MLEIRILVTDLDYDSVVDAAAPLVAQKLAEKGGLAGRLAPGKEKLAELAHKLLQKKDQDARDTMAAELAEKNRSFLMEKAAALAEKKGITLQICDISVKKF